MKENKSTLITAVGVILFLAAGILTMLFFPNKKETKLAVPVKNSSPVASSLSEEISPSVKIPGMKAREPKSDWYVYIVGEVKNPGYYKISADSRIFQAVEAAGGFTKKAVQSSVNMAEFLADGITIKVPAIIKTSKTPATNINKTVRIPGLPAEKIITPAVRATAPANPQINTQGLVDINNASAKDLEQLNGVGPAISKRIIEYRNAHGKFSKPEDLLKVKGIGNAKLEKMRSQILCR